MGNLLAAIANDGKTDIVTQYQYDTANRIAKMITGLSAYSANPTGGAVTQYSYNSLGYLSKITDPMGMFETYNSYDHAGNLLSMTDKNSNTMHNKYGPYGLVKSYFDNSPETKEYIYNNLGQLTAIKSVNANGQSVNESYTYDAFGRMVSATANDGSVQNYTYDSNSNLISYELTEGEDIKNSIAYEYNNLDQLTKLTSNDIITSYDYDANGNLTKKSQNNGVNTDYTYNKAGLMTYMKSKKGNKTYTYSDCKYLLNGLISSVDMPHDANPAEKKVKHYNYDGIGRLTREYVTNAAGVPVDNTYQYDLRGNRVKKVSSLADEEKTETINYEYDLNNRLINENIHVYDEYHNTNTYSSARYYYDYNGNMTAKQVIRKAGIPATQSSRMALSGRSTDTGLGIYRYDAFNRLTNYDSGGTEASYTYNANNLRASKTVNREKTDFVWNGQNLAAENTAGITSVYAYDMTGVHIANQNGTVTSYLKDYHGNIAGKITKSGAVFNEMEIAMDYDAFGNQWSGDAPNPFGYCGEYLDYENGLIYLRNRYYESNIGRFITEDPVKDGTNWYAYAGNNPVMFVDPSGEEVQITAITDWFMKNLRYLSEDTINEPDEYGFVTISNYQENPDAATLLVRRIINDPKLCVLTSVKLDDEMALPYGTSYFKQDSFGNLYEKSGGTIKVNLNTLHTSEVALENGEKEITPEYIGLAHELIHILRAMGGYHKNDRVEYKGKMTNVEELENTGLSFYNNGGRYVNAGEWVTTENAIRDIFGLPRRERYFL